LKDVKVKLKFRSFAYGRTFGVAGHQANVALLFPYLWGTAQGQRFEDQIKIGRVEATYEFGSRPY
jgi:hypothetical protein